MFQAKNGIVPAVGYFGPKTRALLNSLTSATGATNTTALPITDIPIYNLPVSTTTGIIPSRDLFLGIKDPEVRTLQIFLNAHGYTISAVGAGSPGLESDFFGPATNAALIRFQTAYGIIPAVGYFGPKTREALSKLR